jgi:hypothetical protein
VIARIPSCWRFFLSLTALGIAACFVQKSSADGSRYGLVPRNMPLFSFRSSHVFPPHTSHSRRRTMHSDENNSGSPFHAHCCPCGHHHSGDGVNRRAFLGGVGGLAALGGVALTGLSWAALAAEQEDEPTAPVRRPLVVKPVLTYEIPQRRPQTSWRSWGGIQTQQDLDEEKARIQGELEKLRATADFPVTFLPLASARNSQELAGEKEAIASADVTLVYAAGGNAFDLISATAKDTIIFCRHKSGPVYLWYEIISPRFLRNHTGRLAVKGVDDQDVVIDSQDELLWRLRSLCGLRNSCRRRPKRMGHARRAATCPGPLSIGYPNGFVRGVGPTDSGGSRG